MNYSIYVFGVLGNGYTQYPEDETSDYFKSLQKKTPAHTQLAIHRDGELMYFAYTRKLSEVVTNNQYIGLCCVFNGVYTDNYQKLFDIYEKTITQLVVNGDLLEFTDNGEITSKIDKLYQAESYFKDLQEYLSIQIRELVTMVKKLPSINYSISRSDVKRLPVDESPEEITNAIVNYSMVIISKSEDYNTTTLNTYSGKLHALSAEITSLNSANAKQQERITKLEHEKKRTKLVTWLIIILVGIAISLYVLWMKNTDQQIIISQLSRQKDNYQTWVNRLQNDSISWRKYENLYKQEVASNRKLQQSIETQKAENNKLYKEYHTEHDLAEKYKQDKALLQQSIYSLEQKVQNMERQSNASKDKIKPSLLDVKLFNYGNKSCKECSMTTSPWSIWMANKKQKYRIEIYYDGTSTGKSQIIEIRK